MSCTRIFLALVAFSFCLAIAEAQVGSPATPAPVVPVAATAAAPAAVVAPAAVAPPPVAAPPAAPAGPSAATLAALQQLQAMKAANEETLKKQAATLQQLDELEKAVDQIKIFSKRG